MIQIYDNQCFANVNYYCTLYNGTNNIIYLYDSWYKMGFLNRYIILGSNGLIELTIPLKGGRNQKAIFNTIEIDYSTNWRKQHYRAIVSSYAKSPFFEYYNYWFEELYNKKFTYLFEFNNYVILGIIKILKLDVEIIFSASLNLLQHKESQDLRKKWLPKNYDSGDDFIKYLQVFEQKIGFKPNLSIIDIMFSLGPMVNEKFKNHAPLIIY